jgi:pimeloyl-ACP methyl ester carboxylesterase
MTHNTLIKRRRFLGVASAVASPLGLVTALAASAADTDAKPSASRPGAGPWTLKRIRAGVLEVGYAEVGVADGPVALLLHGWPYDVHCYEEAARRLAEAGFRVIVPYGRGFGTTRFLSADTPRNAQQTALASDALALLDALGIQQAVVAGCDWGARAACILAALWPERCKSLVAVSGYLVVNRLVNAQPLPPDAELAWWYQYYFATERGRAGYAKYRREFARLIWQQASPQWRFDDATFLRTAAAFDNPDHVEIVIHNYRWRIGIAPGETRFDAIEAKIQTAPNIGVPTITLEGDANGAPHAEPAGYAGKFSGRYEHRTLRGGIGHNLPQEAPHAFAQAVIDAARA